MTKPDIKKDKSTKITFSSSEATKIAEDLESKSAEDVLLWADNTFGQRLILSTSFQATGMVILDMLSKISPDTRVMTLDTGRLPKATYDLIDQVQDQYDMRIEVQYPDSDNLKKIVTKHGINMFYKSYSLRLLCCEKRKLEPLSKALINVDAWITGLTRQQGGTRTSTHKVTIDHKHNDILKINPIADWDNKMIWQYINDNNVPYNKLYDQGYTSIGCDPCTRPIEKNEDDRSGRWWWEKGMPKECGIHTFTKSK